MVPDSTAQGATRAGSGAPESALRLALEHAEELVRGTSRAALGEADRILADLADTGQRMPAAAAWRFAVCHHRRGDFNRAAEFCAAADDAEGPADELAHLLATHASALWAQGEARESRSLADRALQLADRSEDDGALGVAWTTQALLFALEGDRAANRTAYERALAHGKLADDVTTLVRVHSNLGSMRIEAGRYDRALVHLDQAVALAEDRHVGLLGALANINRSEALLGLGRLDEALNEAVIANEVFAAADAPMLTFALLNEAEIHRIRGNAVRARITYEDAVARAEHTGNAQVLVPALSGLARTSVLDNPDAAAAHAKRALDQPAALGDARAHLAMGWVALAGHDLDEAVERAERAITDAGRRHRLPELGDALELRAVARRGEAGALEDLAEAQTIWHDTGDRIRLAGNRLVRASMSRSRGEQQAARQELHALGVRVDAYRIAGPLQSLSAGDPEAEVHALGSFAVVVDGEPVPKTAWPSRKSRELVKLLAARRGRPVSRESLAEALWPGVPDTAHRLSVALSTARSAFDPERRHGSEHYLVSDGGQVWLDPDIVQVDVAEFEDVAEAALRAARVGSSDAILLLQVAAALYSAPFLAEEPAEWASEVREELQSTAIRVKRALARLLADDGADDEAVTWLMAVLVEDPYDEPAHLDLIRLLARAGRPGEARRAHRRYATRMGEIDVVPQPLASASGNDLR